MKHTITALITLGIATISMLGGAFFLEFKNQGKSHFIDEYVQSEVLGERRIINVRLPWNYAHDANQTYPLIIKFDGDSRLYRHDQALDILWRTTGSTDAIIVAIPNAIGKRNRDLTPSNWHMDSDKNDDRGEGDRFLDFIETELVPSIESRYRTNGKRIVTGYSRGGLMAVYGLLQKPHLFNGAIAFSPALWREDGQILSEMDAYLRGDTHAKSFLFIAIGSAENEKMRKSFSQMETLLTAHAPDTFTWKSIEVLNGDHSTTPVYAVPNAYLALDEYLNDDLAK